MYFHLLVMYLKKRHFATSILDEPTDQKQNFFYTLSLVSIKLQESCQN
jgi:hypothetical protein